MPAAKKSRKAKIEAGNGDGPMTRSRKNVDITTYTTLNDNGAKRPIQVVSKKGLKSDPKHYAELEKRFERIEAKRLENEAKGVQIDRVPVSPEIWEKRNFIFFITHVNVFLYATCFFIQVGTLPVIFEF